MRIVIRRYELIIFGCVMLLSGAVMPSYWNPSRPYLPQPPRPVIPEIVRPIPKVIFVAPIRPRIALTFDDGPHPKMTEKLLEVLKENHVPGTFFVVGKMANRYPDLLKAIALQGNEVANHTYNHPNLSKLSDDAVLNELQSTRDEIRRITGKDTMYYRPPGGDYNRRIVRMASRAGYHMVLWSILTDDVDGASIRAMRRRILTGAEDGGIVLMHSGIENTIEMLPKVIATLKERGYEFVTVSTLLKQPKSSTL